MSHHPNNNDYLLFGLLGAWWLLSEAEREERLEEERDEDRDEDDYEEDGDSS